MRAETFHAIIRNERRGIGSALVRAAFRVVSWPYGLAMRLRNWAYDRGWMKSSPAAVPVISVGNLTLGGTGKTPCVEWIAMRLRDRGIRPVILSRGYGTEHHQNDEAMVLEENLPDVPHLQGADRVNLATLAVEELDAEALILDDGFQHRRLKRTLDIVLLDATRPLAEEAIFPRGLLREPISGLRRADALILTRVDQAKEIDEQEQGLRKRFPNASVSRAIHAPVELIGLNETAPLNALAGKSCAAFCGLGNPEAFRTTLVQLGATVQDFRTFPDHHAYSREDVSDLERWANTFPAETLILTTQKDFVKLRIADLSGRMLWAVRIGFHVIAGERELLRLLEDRVPAPVEMDSCE